MRNSLKEIGSIFNSPDISRALSRVRELGETYQGLYPQLSEKLEEVEGTLSCFHFPVFHRKKVRTTTTLERFNEEIRRRTRLIRIFPNETICLRLILALCIEQSEEWVTGNRYTRMGAPYGEDNPTMMVDPVKGVLEVP